MHADDHELRRLQHRKRVDGRAAIRLWRAGVYRDAPRNAALLKRVIRPGAEVSEALLYVLSVPQSLQERGTNVSSDRRGARCLPFPVRLTLGSSVAFVVFLVGGAVPAFSFPSAGTSSASTTVQLPQRLCGVAVPGESSCLAIRLVTRQVSSATAAKLREAGLARPTAVSSVASGPAGGYSPGQLATAYGVNPAAATSQTVAIVDAFQDPSVTADLDAFDGQYGLPPETSTSFKAVSQTGGSVSGSPPMSAGQARSPST